MRKFNRWQVWLALVTVTGLALRTALYLGYTPASYSDTGGYRRLAVAALKGWRDYDGTRPPGYPLLMALVGPDTTVYLVQLILGLATTLLFFWIGWKLTGSPAFGAAAGLAHTLNLGQLFFEANLLSESLTTFWLALLLAFLVLALRASPARALRGQRLLTWLFWLGVGLCAALAGLTRSLFLFMPVWAALFLAALQTGWRARLAALLAVLLPAAVLVGLWVNFMNTRYGIVGVTTMTGYHLVQHTGDYFELVPESDALLRDTFLSYRDEKIASTGTSANAIWDAIPEMMKVGRLDFHTLSNQLTRISVQLILAHPDRYLANAAEGWWLFWRAPVYWKPEGLGGLRPALEGLVLVERGLLFGMNMLFLGSTLLALVWRRWRDWLKLTPFWVFVILTIWLTSILQTLPDHGDNPRFLIPLQTWVVLWGLWLGEKISHRVHRHRELRNQQNKKISRDLKLLLFVPPNFRG